MKKTFLQYYSFKNWLKDTCAFNLSITNPQSSLFYQAGRVKVLFPWLMAKVWVGGGMALLYGKSMGDGGFP